jgi:precorrin-6Y C5,15-methyltransferase (decarboxylating)
MPAAGERTSRESVTVVGIGVDGWDGLAEVARDRICGAGVVLGSARQLDLVRQAPGTLVAWPSPLLPALPELLARYGDRPVCVLASGDPLYYGIASAVIRLLGPDSVEVIPHVSSISLACARLRWAQEDVEVLSVVGRPVEQLRRVLSPGRRIVVLSADDRTPTAVAELLVADGYGDSKLTVLAQLGGGDERIVTRRAKTWAREEVDPLNVIGIECQSDPDIPVLATIAGLPDASFEHDGQLTKREVRAITLARLVPVPGALLWDVGAGAGSIAIEWMRACRSGRAVAIESHPERAARIARNAAALGVPGLRIVTGTAPAALAGLDPPDAVFVGGGATVPGMLEECWKALRHRGRLVVNAVTLESEVVVADWYARLGGDLTRIAINHASPVGGFTGWRPTLPVTQWTVTKP